MEIIFAPSALEDLQYWKKVNNVAILKRIELLLADIVEYPFTGIGKPVRFLGKLTIIPNLFFIL